MSSLEFVYESNDMYILDNVINVQKIERIIISIYLYHMKIYDYVTDRDIIQLYEPDNIQFAPSNEIDFMIDLCQIILNNGGVYQIVITVQTYE